MKKLFAMFLALTMTFQLITPAWADAATEEPEEITEASEVVEEVEPEEETTEATEETLPEETTEETQEEVSSIEEKPSSAQTYRVTFLCTPEDLTLVVYPKDADIDQAIEPEEDGTYLLETGEYAYLAAAEGYEAKEGTFTAAKDDLSVDIVLTEKKVAAIQEFSQLEEGKCGINAYWTLDSKGVLSITGTGKMYDYDSYPTSAHAPWYATRENIYTIIIESGINYIGKQAFYGCKNVKYVVLPESITEVRTDSGFENMPKGNVILCANNQVPKGWNSYWYSTIACGVDKAQADFWMNLDKNATFIQVPDGVREIYAGAFKGCGKLEYVDIPESVNIIRKEAFSGTNLKMLYIPESVQTIEGTSEYNSPFYECPADLLLICGTDSKQPGWDTYWNGPYKIQAHVYYGKSRQEVDAWRSIDKSVSEIQIPDGITLIPYGAFKDRTSLTKIILPDSIKEIDEWAFAGCTGLRSLYIPESVEIIHARSSAKSPFYSCRSNLLLGCGAQGSGAGWEDGWTNGRNVIYGCTRQECDYWGAFPDQNAEEVIIPDGITTIPEKAFAQWTNLRNVTIPGSVKTIQNYAFMDCTSLTSVTMEAGVMTLGYSVFRGCTSLRSITIPDTVVQMDDSVFYKCTSLESATLSSNIKILGSSTFSWCENLQYVDIGNVETIKGYAFSSCTALKTCYIPQSVTSMAAKVFAGCSRDLRVYCGAESRPKEWEYSWDSVSDYGVNSSVKAIYGVSPEEYTYWIQLSPDVTELAISSVVRNMPDDIGSLFPKVRTLHIPSSVRRIGNSAFAACDDLVSVTIEPGVESIGERAFMGCPITQIDLPNTLTSMGKDTFWFCSALREVKIPGSLKIVPDGAFRECSNIRKVTLEEGIEELGSELFESSSGITKLVIPASVHKIGYGLVDTNSSVRIEYRGTMREWAAMRPTMSAYCSDGYMIDGGTCGDLNVSIGEKVVWFIKQSAKEGKYVLTIFGDGAIGDNVDADKVRWAEYRDEIEEVIIEEGVDRIGECAFWGCRNLKKITLPKSLECITQYAFSWCHSLKEIAIPENVDTIGYQAFYDCYNLTTINFLQGADDDLDIVEEAFITDGRTASTTVRVPDTKNINPAIRNFNWKANRRSVSYGYLNCLEKAKSISILSKGEAVPESLKLDMSQTSRISFHGVIEPEGALQTVQWSSSAKAVAAVNDDGEVTLLKPGTAVISAATADGSKLTAKVTLNVVYVDAAKTLTIRCDAPEVGLQIGKTAKLTVFGEQEIPVEYLRFSIPEDQQAIAMVDDAGDITAGTRTGTVTVTAELKNDPLARKGTLKINVIPKQTRALRVTVADEEKHGVFISDDTGASFALDMIAVKDRDIQIPIIVEALDDEENWEQTKAVTYICSDPAVADVGTDGILTVKRMASGQCEIRIQSMDLMKTETRLKVIVEDKSPRLETSSLTLNGNLTDGLQIGFVESYGNSIQKVQISDERFEGTYRNDHLQIKAAGALNNGNYSVTLSAICADGQTYTYPLTIKVTNTLPKPTVKQTAKLNLFYKNSTAPLAVTVPGQTIENVELTDTEDFALEPSEDGWEIVYTTENAKPDTKGTLNVYLEDYQTPVQVNLTVGTVTTAPAVKLSAASSTLNTALNQNLTTQVRLLDKAGQPLELENPKVECSNADVKVDGSLLTITLDEAKSTTVTMYLQDSTWARSVKLTHKVTVSEKLPTLKPAGNLTLNSLFAKGTAETGFILSQSNLTLVNVEAIPAAKAGTPALAESEKLNVTYDPETGHMMASIKDTDNAPKAGTYSFKCTGTLETGETIPGGTLKVTVSSAAPKVKLSATSVKLNKFLAGAEQGSVTVTASDGYQVVDFTGRSEGMTFDEDTGILTVTLENASDNGGSYTLYPVVRDVDTGEEVELPTKLSFKVQAYNSQKLSVSLSAKGKLDTQTDSEMLYTVTKLTGCLGTVDNVTLEGQDANLFRAEMDVVNGKPTVHLTLVDGETYATNKAYKIQFRFYACGQEILSPVQTVKVTQTALKVTVPKNITYYQAQKSPLRVVLTSNVPLDEVTLNSKTAKEFQAAVGEVALNGDRVEFEIANPAALTAGKSYSVALDATPENNAENAKPVTVRLTVKVQK